LPTYVLSVLYDTGRGEGALLPPGRTVFVGSHRDNHICFSAPGIRRRQLDIFHSGSAIHARAPRDLDFLLVNGNLRPANTRLNPGDVIETAGRQLDLEEAPAFDPAWRSRNDSVVQKLVLAIYETRSFGELPVLADALEDVGCDKPRLLNHLRTEGPHNRRCWALDLILGWRRPHP
jgi:hypothetical protein